MEHPKTPHYHTAPPKGRRIMMDRNPTPNNRNKPVNAADLKLMRGVDDWNKVNSEKETY
jgi:hypothetical protein